MYNFAKLNWIKLEGLSDGLEIMAVMQKQEGNLFPGYLIGRHATTAPPWICTKGTGTINEKLNTFWAASDKLNVYEEFPLGI